MSNYHTLLREAERLSGERRPTDALLLLLQAVRINRHGVEAQCALAETWEHLGRADQAIATWREALRWHSLPRIQAALARLLWQGGEAKSASSMVSAALAQDPGRVDALLLWAEMLRVHGRDQEMRLTLIKAGDSVAIPPVSWRELDEGLRRCGEIELADKLFLRLQANLPSSVGKLLAGLSLPEGAYDPATRAVWIEEAMLREDWSEAELNEALWRLDQRADVALLGRSLGRRYRDVVARRLHRQGGLHWPKRCAGEMPRVGVVQSTWKERAADGMEPLLLAASRGQVSLRGYAVDEKAPETTQTGSVVVAGLGHLAPVQAARWLAEEDCDVLLVREEACSARLAEILAHHPAMKVLSWGVVAPAVAWLTDGAYTHGDAAVDGLLGLLASADSGRPQGTWTATELRSRWQTAVQWHQAGEVVAADQAYTAILAEQGAVPRVLHLRGALRRDQGSARAALSDFHAAFNVAPSYVDPALAQIELLTELGAHRDAAEFAFQVLHLVEDDPRLWRAGGGAARKARRLEEAQQALQQAAILAPGDASAWFNLGLVAQERGDDEIALDALQKAALLDPTTPEAFYNLGALHQQRNAHERAANCYEQAIRLKPDDARAYKNLGEMRFASGNYPAWLASFQRFEQHCPGSFSLVGYALEACQFMGDWNRLDYYLNGLQKQRFQPRDATELVDGLEELLYLLLFFDFEPPDMGRFYRTYAEAAAKVYGAPRTLPPERRPGRWRVGYLSGDVRDQVMGKMIHQWLLHHDRERFEVFLFATRPAEGNWGERISVAAEHFEDLSRQDDPAAIERILEADLDLLVDCSTHTRGARQAILAAKPARVQITSIASAGCLGLSTIDFKLTDSVADLPESQEHQVEPFLAMAGCVYPFRHIEAAATHGYHRDRLGIGTDAVVLGAFVTLLKLSRRCLKLWREILECVPRAVIALSPVNPGQRDAYVRVFQSAGIDSGRLVFVPQGRDEMENQARYHLVDIVLDPMPFGGANGTIEALGMGVPVVTLCGRRHGERVGTSILSYLGVTDLIAQTGPEYVDLVCRLAEEPNFLAQVRARIRAGLEKSVFTGVAAHVRNLEAAYEVAIRHGKVRYGEEDGKASGNGRTSAG